MDRPGQKLANYHMTALHCNTHRLLLAMAVWLASIWCWIFEKIPDQTQHAQELKLHNK